MCTIYRQDKCHHLDILTAVILHLAEIIELIYHPLAGASVGGAITLMGATVSRVAGRDLGPFAPNFALVIFLCDPLIFFNLILEVLDFVQNFVNWWPY